MFEAKHSNSSVGVGDMFFRERFKRWTSYDNLCLILGEFGLGWAEAVEAESVVSTADLLLFSSLRLVALLCRSGHDATVKVVAAEALCQVSEIHRLRGTGSGTSLLYSSANCEHFSTDIFSIRGARIEYPFVTLTGFGADLLGHISGFL